jgi:hypothetical protein
MEKRQWGKGALEELKTLYPTVDGEPSHSPSNGFEGSDAYWHLLARISHLESCQKLLTDQIEMLVTLTGLLREEYTEKFQEVGK